MNRQFYQDYPLLHLQHLKRVRRINEGVDEFTHHPLVVPYGLAVRIPGFHPGGPGSTPGMGTFFITADLHIVLTQEDNYRLSELQETLVDTAGLCDFFVAEVPKWKPLTKVQFMEAQKYWPCHFYEDKRQEISIIGVDLSVYDVKKN